MVAAGPSTISNIGLDFSPVRIFLSWSGLRSKELARIFKTYINDLFPKANIYLSLDIAGGNRWRENLEKGLEDRNFSIIFLTEANLNSKWLYFEAGALSKAMVNDRIQPFLYNLSLSNLSEPLSSYQAREINKEEILKTIYDINNLQENSDRIEKATLERNFNRLWNEMNSELKEIEKIDDTVSDTQISDANLLMDQSTQTSEILQIVRQLQQNKQSVMKTRSEETTYISSNEIKDKVSAIIDTVDLDKGKKNKDIIIYELVELLKNDSEASISTKSMRKSLTNIATRYAVKLVVLNEIIDKFKS
ncbi:MULTISPECIES: hypothetical protein [unclassified Enterococcus]|uniref:hypothetical protein n=1 Tax=unclassified Enterococcus TaxID=2608891 RepID=UPI0015556E6D|nr:MULTISPECIES: hypothetical protein [unclassified Enterococcus]MBS7577988.1 hypothetical protein [Enterococcus sp. MMGLQ5-2]MBS7585151.1 hypothetical protein [Enterococcus sp. MMGLQ5-1]NPD13007.1 hypothetical protein [Enterococcus sp. MMGLQ5-1]NPD37819.1 hypothetical protein [Enterococcus sp. MMGLQ5-2]